jgi:hypothetical protein
MKNDVSDMPQSPVIFHEVAEEFVPGDEFTLAASPKRGRGRPKNYSLNRTSANVHPSTCT